ARSQRMTEGRPYKVEGIGGDKIPTSLHWDVIDEWITVSDKDAMLVVRRLAKEEGLFAGGSTGVNLVAALAVARRVNDPQALVVDADLPVDRLTTLLSRETPAALVRREGKIAGIVTRYDVLHLLAGIR